MNFSHISVMPNECIQMLNIKKDGIYFDGTAGGGGHSALIAEKITTGRVISTDIDIDAVTAAKQRLADYPCSTVLKRSYTQVTEVLEELEIDGIDGMLLDLGVSSHQLDTRERGFSYHGEAPLDMRMGDTEKTAQHVVNNYDVNELTKMFRDNADEKFARKMAYAICDAREETEITTTAQLSEIINTAMPAAVRRAGNPSKSAFQAIRIEVNNEFDNIREGITAGFDALNTGGRMCIITFHSIEDRIVKNLFREFATGCTCPKDFPICVCGKTPRGKIITRKPMIPTPEEIEINIRSRSAKVRVIEKL